MDSIRTTKLSIHLYALALVYNREESTDNWREAYP
jgi:hypothetical protein